MSACPKEVTLQAYVDRELPSETLARVRSHLEACSHCAEAAGAMNAEIARIGDALALNSPEQVPTLRLQKRVDEALSATSRQGGAFMEKLWPLAWIGASAILVAVIIASRRSDENRAPSLQPVALNNGISINKQAATRAPGIIPASRLHRRRNHRQTTILEHTETVTQFFSLREIDDVYEGDLRMVRIELPKSSITQLGLPFDPEAGNTAIRADVILGEDGIARAIRFVH